MWHLRPEVRVIKACLKKLRVRNPHCFVIEEAPCLGKSHVRNGQLATLVKTNAERLVVKLAALAICDSKQHT